MKMPNQGSSTARQISSLLRVVTGSADPVGSAEQGVRIYWHPFVAFSMHFSNNTASSPLSPSLSSAHTAVHGGRQVRKQNYI